jgi:hypothetical protein
MEDLNEITESIRQAFINLEKIRARIKELKNTKGTDRRLKIRLEELSTKAIDGVFYLYDFLADTEKCLDENDLIFLLEHESVI